MRLNSNKNSLTLLCLLAGIVYLLILIPSITEGIEGGIEGVREGARERMQRSKAPDSSEDFDSTPRFLQLKPKERCNYHPDSILNIATNTQIPARFETVHLYYKDEQPVSLWSILFEIFLILTSIPIVILLILIPILFYKLIISLYRNEVFTQENVKKIKKIGIYCIITYTYMFLFQLHVYLKSKKAIDFEQYDIVFPQPSNETLLFGVISLIVATVINRAIVMKEEQDLTI